MTPLHLITPLDSTERLLMDVLHRPGGDSVVRAHLERALVHVREAIIGVRNPGCCRTVGRLTRERDGFERVLAHCLASRPGDSSASSKESRL